MLLSHFDLVTSWYLTQQSPTLFHPGEIVRTLFTVFSMYLKTAIVGLNDNSIPLTSTEDIAKDEYNNMKK